MVKNINFSEFLNQNKISIQGGLFALFFIVTFISVKLLENNLGNGITQSKIQNVISAKELELENSLNHFAKRIDNSNQNFYFSEEDLMNCRKTNLNYFIYQYDSLIAWTDNEVIPPYKARLATSTQVLKLNDGYYIGQRLNYKSYQIIGIYLLEHNYQFENEHLKNKINEDFHIYKKLAFKYNHENTEYTIQNNKGHYLFGLNFQKNPMLSKSQSILLFILYFITLVTALNFILLLLKRKFKKVKLVVLFSVIIILLRIFLQIIKWPELLYLSEIFTPSSFAISFLLPSLGDLFLSVYFTFIIILVISQEIGFKSPKKLNPILKYLIGFSLILIAFTLFYESLILIRNLILNSNINFDVSNFFGLTTLSIIGLIIITGILFTLLIILFKLIKYYDSLFQSKRQSYLLSLISFILITLINHLLFQVPLALLSLFFILILILQFNSRAKSFYSLANILPVLLVLAFITSISMNRNVYEAEHMRRQSIARSVAINQDPQVEYLFHEIEKKIYKDTTLLIYFHNNDISFDSISNYIIETYFNTDAHWSKYDLQSTICDNTQELVIKPENIRILCSDFFFKNLIAYGTLTSNKNLYHLQYGTGQINYLGIFQFVEKTMEGDVTYTIYLEVNSKLKRKGFTKLLSEEGNDPFEKLRGYSLAAYHNDTLIENYGSYSYPEILEKTTKTEEEMLFKDKNDYNHLFYRNNMNEFYVLSKKIPEKLTMIAPFSYIFILFALVFISFAILLNKSILNWSFETNFTDRLQLTMIAIIIVSFTMISYFSAHYIVSLNNEKNNQTLKDLSSSLQLEFEHKVSNLDVSQEEINRDYLQTLSIKFSKVFDTDINLFNLNGDLISATRPEIFDKHLLSEKINPMAFYKLSKEKESFYVTQENIGGLIYSSAYLPFHNNRKEVVAYLNLPYFARQRELQNEVSSFLMTLMNVYTFIIVLSIIVILLISNYISRPLRMIKEKLQRLTLGATNEKIEWKGEDEIGRLVAEYNRMVDQMAIKADLLAKSERESAWREMAKQVAHEIKNPLTPMKLSVQYLLRSWNEKDPDWEDRLYRLSETLIQQIDTLSDIATAFSDFAKMPKSNNEKIELNEIINNAVELYADYDNLQINFSSDASQSMNIYADRKQLLRVFNNLIKNAIQSFELNQNGFIDIDIEQSITDYHIHIRDNGCGIPEDKKAMIFVPNFTTKSKGTGLGLAMVKNIILSFGGLISFESEEGKGTIFTIVLPKYEDMSGASIDK
jgi:signal transduction histidine kinase